MYQEVRLDPGPIKENGWIQEKPVVRLDPISIQEKG